MTGKKNLVWASLVRLFLREPLPLFEALYSRTVLFQKRHQNFPQLVLSALVVQLLPLVVQFRMVLGYPRNYSLEPFLFLRVHVICEFLCLQRVEVPQQLACCFQVLVELCLS